MRAPKGVIMRYNFVDSNLFDLRGHILSQMKSGNVRHKIVHTKNSIPSGGMSRDVLVKTSLDGKDDGKISLKEKLSNFGKGIIQPLKSMVSSPKNIAITALSVAAGAAIITLTGGAAAPLFVAAGITGGAIQIGKGVYNQATAKTDAQARKAWQQIGSGTFTTGVSALAAKSSLKSAGVENAGKMSVFKAVVRCFKDIPSNIHKCINNASINISAALTKIKPKAKEAPATESKTTELTQKTPEGKSTATESKLTESPKKTSEGEAPTAENKPTTPKSTSTEKATLDKQTATPKKSKAKSSKGNAKGTPDSVSKDGAKGVTKTADGIKDRFKNLLKVFGLYIDK